MPKTAVTSGSRRFCFVQLEFPWALGPEAGRHTIRERLGEAPACVLVLQVLGAPERRLVGRQRRARSLGPAPELQPEAVLTSRATMIDTAPLAGPARAERWLSEIDADAVTATAVARLNRVLHAHAAATADPYLREVSRGQALVVRIGFGTGEHVADGRWERALELPRAPSGALRPGMAVLRPQERLAALLAGRDAVLACEVLTLRVRLDADAERWREAALGLRIALQAALAELAPWDEIAGLPARVDELGSRLDDVSATADAALAGGLGDAQIEIVRSVLGRIEAALRARTAGGIG
ncbi:MAG TPA: hypothetical protein VHZ75_01975 [Solirubrobacteraceae bacterium]|nr:hypothetical protein [Solirubrobacteraceae bacterium]